MDIGTAKLTGASGGACRTTCSTSGTSPRPPASPSTRTWPTRSSPTSPARGKVPVLVGGSGLYIRAALGDLDSPAPTRRSASGWRPSWPSAGPARCMPGCRAPIPPRRPRSCPATAAGSSARLRSSSCPGARSARRCPATTAGRPAVQLGVQVDRARSSTSRIEARVDRMWAAGFEAEVRRAGRPRPARRQDRQPRPRLPAAAPPPRRRADQRPGPRRDRPRHPPLRPPPGILVQARPPGAVAGAGEGLRDRAMAEIAVRTRA